jgi:hypothetical protein
LSAALAGALGSLITGMFVVSLGAGSAAGAPALLDTASANVGAPGDTPVARVADGGASGAAGSSGSEGSPLSTRPESLFGGDRDPNWWGKRGEPTSGVVTDLASARGSGPSQVAPTPALARDTEAETTLHWLGRHSFRAPDRWRELNTSSKHCSLADGSSVLVASISSSHKGSLDLSLTDRTVSGGASDVVAQPCSVRVGDEVLHGRTLVFTLGGVKLQSRVFAPRVAGDRVILTMRGPAGALPLKEVEGILQSLR